MLDLDRVDTGGTVRGGSSLPSNKAITSKDGATAGSWIVDRRPWWTGTIEDTDTTCHDRATTEPQPSSREATETYRSVHGRRGAAAGGDGRDGVARS